MAAPVAFFVLLLPSCLIAACSDLRNMTIPNGVVLLTLGLYIVAGPFLRRWGSISGGSCRR